MNKTVLEFLYELDNEIKSLSLIDDVWFRGQSDSSYNLIPSLLRYSNGLSKETRLFKEFRKNAYRLIERKNSDWEVLFDMQHYGAPTRLLDWTDTLGIALFFATYYNIKNNIPEDAALYLLLPNILNKKSSLNDIPFLPHDLSFNYKEIYWNKNPYVPVYPIAIEPDYANDRIKAQTGKFTIHGDDTTAIEILNPTAVKKIVIPKSIISEILEYLKLFNITSNAIYPDMQGMVEYVKDLSNLS